MSSTASLGCSRSPSAVATSALRLLAPPRRASRSRPSCFLRRPFSFLYPPLRLCCTSLFFFFPHRTSSTLRLSLRFTFFSAASKAFFGSPWTLNEVEMNAVKCTKKQSQTVAFDAEEGQCAYFYSKINDKRCFLVFEAIGTFYYFHSVL